MGKRTRWSIPVFLLLALAMPAAGQSPDVSGEKRLIDIAVKNADLESVLRMLSENYDLNIITDGNLNGTVTTKLRGVSIDDALSALLRARGYHFVRQGDIIIVKENFGGKSDMVTRLFSLDYIDADALKESCAHIVSKEGNLDGFSRNLLAMPEGPLYEDRIFTERKDVLLVTDFPDVVETIGEMVRVLDVAVPQVMIEVRFIERGLRESDQIGINWNIEAEVSGEPPIDPSLAMELGGTAGLELPNKVFQEGDFVFGQLKLHQFSAILQLIEQSGTANLLCNPKVATLDNHEARITIGTKILIPVRERGINSEVVLESYEEMDIGISLSVIPHTHANGDITLQVQPSVEEITGYTGEFEDRPIIAERTALTQITVKGGETVAIGGLIRDVEVETVKRVPLLGKIPLLKYLFTHRSMRKEKTDLLIFITPSVIQN
jgi:type IV pilus assembly protein PilQ